MSTFSELGLNDALVDRLASLEIVKPTEIQQKAIPALLDFNPDFIGIAQTGTGKTAAFVLPLIQLILTDEQATQAIVVAPTRELVQQIHRVLFDFTKGLMPVTSSVVYGGTPVSKQVKKLKKKSPHIILGTPGRLIDLIKRGAIDLKNCRYAILDEADEMLNMGFQEDVDFILGRTSDNCKYWLFSATMPAPIRDLVDRYMDKPQEVRVKSHQKTNANIQHEYILVDKRDKYLALKRIVDFIDELYCVVFCKTKIDTQELADALNRDGYKAGSIHGDLSQQQRNNILKSFKTGALNILIATDVVARGIDIDDLTHVIHFSLPDDRSYYTHRSGRTARAGKSGTSLSIVSPSDQYKIRQFESRLKINIQKVTVPLRSEVENKRIGKWLQDVADTEITIEEFSEQTVELLNEYSKEELMAKLISRQLKLAQKKEGKDDLNVVKGRKSEKSKRSKTLPATKKGYTRIFINIGKVDGISMGQLVKLISKQGGYSKNDVGAIKILKRYSTFELKDQKAKRLEKDFRKTRFRGREVFAKIDS